MTTPAAPPSLADQVQAAADGAGSVAALAGKVADTGGGVTRERLYAIIAGETPGVRTLLAIARATDQTFTITPDTNVGLPRGKRPSEGRKKKSTRRA